MPSIDKFPVEIPLDKNLSLFIGAVLGDGFLGTRSNQVQITGDAELDEQYFKKVLAPICRQYFCYAPSIKISNTAIRLRVYSKQLKYFLHEEYEIPIGVKCYTAQIPSKIQNSTDECKRACLRGLFDTDGGVFFDRRKTYKKPYVPNYIKQLPPAEIEAFLDAFAKGDATMMRSGHRIFYTSSKRLADDIQELLLKIGRVGVVKQREARGNRWIVDHWADGSRTQYEVHERVKKGDSWLDRRDTRTVPYDGTVWCATVKNHVMYVRRNGKPYWCGNTSMFWSEPNKLFNNTLKKMEGRLREHGHVGYIDINCIVNGNGIYPLEFTSRFGYPTIAIQQEGLSVGTGELLHGLASGKLKRFKTKTGFQVGARICVPPFPFQDKRALEEYSKDAAIIFKKQNLDGVHIEDVKEVNGQWLVTGNVGIALVVCGAGSTMKEAQKQMYNRINNILIPNMYYRTDIGDRWAEDSDRLHSWGYLREA